jgi:hypothetical protein
MGSTIFAQLMDDQIVPAVIVDPVFYDPDNARSKS